MRNVWVGEPRFESRELLVLVEKNKVYAYFTTAWNFSVSFHTGKLAWFIYCFLATNIFKPYSLILFYESKYTINT